jgi:hypothetical protein
MWRPGKRCPLQNLIPKVSYYSLVWQADVTHVFSSRLLSGIRSPLWIESQTILPHWSPTPESGTACATLGHMWSMHDCQNRRSRPALLPIIICRTTMSSVKSQTFCRWQQQSKESRHTQTHKKRKERQKKEEEEKKDDILSCTPTPSSFPCLITRIFFFDLDSSESKLKFGTVSLSRIYDVEPGSMSS